jgi:hypothetical protein
MIPNEYLNDAIMKSDNSIEIQRPLPIIQPYDLYNDAYGKLTDKVLSAFSHIAKYYGGYEWYLKADDDTFVFVDNLKFFLKTKNSSDLVSYGYDHHENGYQHGGAGYVFGKSALKLLAQTLQANKSFCPNHGIEDRDVGQCLRKLNVKIASSKDHLERNRFHNMNAHDHSNKGSYWFVGEKVIKKCELEEPVVAHLYKKMSLEGF